MKRTICKGCGVEFPPGRRSKTYCSNACKQTAYYNRRKASLGKDDNEEGFVKSKNSGAAYGDGTVTHHRNVAAANDFRTADYVSASDHHSPSNPTNPITPIHLISRPLSMEHYDNSNEERDFSHEERDFHRPQQHQSQQPIKLMGMNVDKEWFRDVLQMLPQDQQRQLSEMMLETINETFPDLTEGRPVTDSGYDRGNYSSDSAQPDVYRLNAGSDDDEEDEDYTSDDGDDLDSEEDDGYNSDDKQDDSNGEDNDSDDNDDSDEEDVLIPKRRGKAGSYLNRFSSARIRRGLTIWEELSVAIPPFMEDYVTSYATDAGMLVHPIGAGKGGLVTVHILFHLAHHRRSVCRLLDLVLEAEDGTLRRRDFMPGGAFATSKQENRDTATAVTSEIDYDCSDNGMQHRNLSSVGQGYTMPMQTPVSMPMYGYSNPLMHMQHSPIRRSA